MESDLVHLSHEQIDLLAHRGYPGYKPCCVESLREICKMAGVVLDFDREYCEVTMPSGEQRKLLKTMTPILTYRV